MILYHYDDKIKVAHTFTFSCSQNDQKDDSLSDAVNFELDFDVVPSSNPCSQDIFTPDEFFETYNEFEEVFDKDNIHQCTSICGNIKFGTTKFLGAEKIKI